MYVCMYMYVYKYMLLLRVPVAITMISLSDRKHARCSRDFGCQAPPVPEDFASSTAALPSTDEAGLQESWETIAVIMTVIVVMRIVIAAIVITIVAEVATIMTTTRRKNNNLINRLPGVFLDVPVMVD